MSLVAATAAWLIVVARFRASWRTPVSVARRSLWLTVFALAVAWTFKVDAVFAWVDRVSGVPDLSQLVSDLAGVGTGAAILTVLVAQRDTAGAARRFRRTWVGLGALAAAMTGAFAAGRFTTEQRQFTVAYVHSAAYWAYETPFVVATAIIFGSLAVWAARYARAADTRLVAAGMRTASAGGVLGLVYVTVRVAFTVSANLGAGGWAGVYGALSESTAAVASLLAILGAFTPALGPTVAARRAGRTVRDLLPLWRDLHEAGLMSSLIDPDGADAHARPGFTARRLTVEIDDGILRLRPWLTGPADTDHGNAGQGVDAAELTARRIGDGLGRRAAGHAPAPGAIPGPRPSTSIDDETRWLRAVARAYRRHRTAPADPDANSDPTVSTPSGLAAADDPSGSPVGTR